MGDKIEWIQIHLNEIKKYFKKLKRRYVIFLTLFVILTFLVFLSVPFIIDTRMDAADPNLIGSPELLVKYLKLVTVYTIMQAHSTLFETVFVIIWWGICFLLFLIMRLIVDGFYQIFYPSDNQFEKKFKRFKKALYKILNKRFNLVFIILIPFYIFTIFKSEPWNKKPETAIFLAIKLIIFSVLIIYIFYWGNLLAIRKKRSSNYVIDEYCFSHYSIRRRFKNVVDGIMFMAIFIWIFLSSLMIGIEFISNSTAAAINNSYNYNETWKTIYDLNESRQEDNNKSEWRLPPPERLSKTLNPTSVFTDKKSLSSVLNLLKSRLFMVVVLIGIFEVGAPVLLKTYFKKGFRSSIKLIAITTIRSSIFVGVLYLVIKNAFSVDLSTSTLGIFFTFIMTFFFIYDLSMKKKN